MSFAISPNTRAGAALNNPNDLFSMKRLLIPFLALALCPPVHAAPQSFWVRSINTAQLKGDASYIGECSNWLITKACPEGKPVRGTVSVGSTVFGMKVGAIFCEYQDSTMRGWRGGPDYVAFKGLYNCTAAPTKRAASATGDSARRPWIHMVGARF